MPLTKSSFSGVGAAPKRRGKPHRRSAVPQLKQRELEDLSAMEEAFLEMQERSGMPDVNYAELLNEYIDEHTGDESDLGDLALDAGLILFPYGRAAKGAAKVGSKLGLGRLLGGVGRALGIGGKTAPAVAPKAVSGSTSLADDLIKQWSGTGRNIKPYSQKTIPQKKATLTRIMYGSHTHEERLALQEAYAALGGGGPRYMPWPVREAGRAVTPAKVPLTGASRVANLKPTQEASAAVASGASRVAGPAARRARLKALNPAGPSIPNKVGDPRPTWGWTQGPGPMSRQELVVDALAGSAIMAPVVADITGVMPDTVGGRPLSVRAQRAHKAAVKKELARRSDRAAGRGRTRGQR